MIQLDLTPDPATPFFTLQTTIEGRDYDFTFAWNERRSVWTVTMATTSGEAMFVAQVLKHGRNLLSRCVSPLAPTGALFVWCNTPADLSPPGVGDLGGRAGVYYATVDELA